MIQDHSISAQNRSIPAHSGSGVLIPFNAAEAISLTEAARIAKRSSTETLRRWCVERGIGRNIAGRWFVSRVALAMLLDGDHGALKRYVGGDRSSPDIVDYQSRLLRPEDA